MTLKEQINQIFVKFLLMRIKILYSNKAMQKIKMARLLLSLYPKCILLLEHLSQIPIIKTKMEYTNQYLS